MIELGSLTVRIYGERGARMEQCNSEVSAIELPAFSNGFSSESPDTMDYSHHNECKTAARKIEVRQN